ncbi:hypothetical protein [Neisseria leonii]|uniref:hypothetical protein n=1 Tax=Neisseria leonii TaxID=2995413 RepID=UPI00237BEC0C|nr:hypothetical protein [Neisseria sp. 3986]MDD9325210.1 hypothetical protein [Neisseria sp. 3986]
MRLHTGSIIILICGLAALIPGLMTLLGFGEQIHALLDEPIAAVALLAIGVSCLSAALFPLAATYLTRREQGKKTFDD